MSPMLLDLQASIDRLRDTRPTWFSVTSPDSILFLAAYNTGGSHATTEIATGGPTPDWNINDISADASALLAYIRVEQLKLTRSMGGDAFKSAMEARMMRRMGGDASKFNVLDRRSNVGFYGSGSPDEDPELFDEATGPIPSHPAD